MRLALVVQRYGLDVAGGAEYHCRLVAEHLARHAAVTVLTTCASDYVTWANHHPEGEEVLNGVPVRRFTVERPRALVYASVEERQMIERASGKHGVLGEVVGVGSELPERLDPAGFGVRHRLEGSFLLYVGRIDRNKGCPQIFEFFRRYRQETGSPLRLVLIGRSPSQVPPDEGILAPGFQPDQEKWDALAASSVFVLPSPLESLSMATLEACWAERPYLDLLGRLRREDHAA